MASSFEAQYLRQSISILNNFFPPNRGEMAGRKWLDMAGRIFAITYGDSMYIRLDFRIAK